MRYFLIFFMLLIASCGQTREVVKTQIVHDTIIRQMVKTVKLPVKNVTIIENPCNESILKPISQVVKTESSNLKIKSENGNLVIEQDIDSTVTSRSRETVKRIEKQVETITVTKKVTPKWAWWALGTILFYIAYRIARWQIPFLRFLPY